MAKSGRKFTNGRGEGGAIYRCEDCNIMERVENLTSGCPECGQTMVPVDDGYAGSNLTSWTYRDATPGRNTAPLVSTGPPRVFVQDSDFTLYVGDVRDCLRELPDQSVHTVVTSPPYWGLRDYGTGAWEGGHHDRCAARNGVDPGPCDCEGVTDCDHLGAPHRTQSGFNERYFGKDKTEGWQDKQGELREPYKQVCGKCGATRIDQQLGLEPTPEAFVTAMVDVFREVRRVLRDDGTLWLNLGDSYNSRLDGSHGGWNGSSPEPQTVDHRGPTNSWSGQHRPLAQKNLLGMPWRVAFALQQDGWILRSDIIWSKPNPMPESVTDRPTKAHEYVFLLTKSPRYFFDQEAVREAAEYGFSPSTGNDWRQGTGSSTREPERGTRTVTRGSDLLRRVPQGETLDGSEGEAPRGPDGRRATAVKGGDGSIQHRDGERWPNGGRNVRSVWEIATQPYPDAHFATFPEALPERCIKAGTSERGCCPECGAPWTRETESTPEKPNAARVRNVGGRTDGLTRPAEPGGLGSTSVKTVGWHLRCGHALGLAARNAPLTSEEPLFVPCTVLDPFMGSGTTALVARRLGRRSIGVELNPEYAELCARRLQQLSLLV